MGAAGGVLITALVSLLAWGLLLLPNVDNPEDPALMVGVAAGFIASGYAAGRLAQPAAPHGMLAGLLMATIVGVVSIASGSPARLPTIIILVILAAALGRSAGAIAGRR